MNESQAIRSAIQKLSKTDRFESVLGKVVSVDTGTRTCEVQPLDDQPNILQVRLNANESPEAGIVIIPKQDSFVIVGQTALDQPHILMFSEIDSIQNSIENMEYKLNANGLKLTVGSNDLKEGLTDLLTALEQLTVNTPNGVSSVPVNVSAITAAKDKILATLQ